MLRRPLGYVSVLTLGDYLLWNWSLNGNHEVLALVSGLTLPPLALALVWLLVLSAARLIARSTSPSGRTVREQRSSRPAPAAEPPEPVSDAPTLGDAPAPARSAVSTGRSTGHSSGKIAA